MKKIVLIPFLLIALSTCGQVSLLLNVPDRSVFFPTNGIGGEFKTENLSVSGTNRSSELVVTNGITLGGTRITEWPEGGSSGSSWLLDYNFNPNEPPPTSGQVRRNAGETILSAHKIGNDGLDHTTILSQIPVGTTIYLQDWNDSTRWVKYISTGLSSLVADTYYAIPIDYVSDSGIILLTQRIVVHLSLSSPDPVPAPVHRNFYLMRPDYGDGVGAVPQTNNFTASGLMHYTFSGTANTNANWVVYEVVTPHDIVSSVGLTAKFTFIGNGSDPDPVVFHLTFQSVPAGNPMPAASAISLIPIVMSITPDTPAAGRVQASAEISLGGWVDSLWPRAPFLIKLARATSSNTDTVRDMALVIDYAAAR